MCATDNSRATICAANNADWYDAFFQAHGILTSRSTNLWSTVGHAPAHHSNLLVLQPDCEVEVIQRISFLQNIISTDWALKDGFAQLDLVKQGFSPLFEAQWVCIEDASTPAILPVGWKVLRTAIELDAWQTEWAKTNPSGASDHFKPALLANSRVQFLAHWRDGRPTSGVIVNHSATVSGFSNFFSIEDDLERGYCTAFLAAKSCTNGRPLVGFESGEALDFAIAFGFETCGQLRIWVKQKAL